MQMGIARAINDKIAGVLSEARSLRASVVCQAQEAPDIDRAKKASLYGSGTGK